MNDTDKPESFVWFGLPAERKIKDNEVFERHYSTRLGRWTEWKKVEPIVEVRK